MTSGTMFELDTRLDAGTHLVTRHQGIQVRIADDSRYFWLMLVPETPDASELHDLGDATQQRLMRLATLLGAWLKAEAGADKINTAAIGNIVSQLHVHVVARRQGDDAWPAPIWGHGEPVPMHEDLRQSRIGVIQAGLEKEPE